MIKARVLNWKTLACLVFLLTWVDGLAQCALTINNPPCQPAGPVDLTAPAITAGTANLGTLSYWNNLNATGPLANPGSITTSGIYYIKNTVGACSDVKPVIVQIGTVSPTGTANVFPDCPSPLTTTNAIFFDWHNNIGETGFTYSYSIDGGPATTVTTGPSPSSVQITGLTTGQRVDFWVSYTGVCTPPVTTHGYPKGTPVFSLSNGQHLCQGTALPTTDNNGVEGVWNHPIVSNVNGSPGNYVFTPARCATSVTYSLFADPLVTPTFNPIPAVCQGSPAPILPTTSTNGITGTWNGTVNTANVGTQNFIFTPNAGQCVTGNATISVTVSQTITPTFAFSSTTLCQNGPSPVLPTTSTNGITGTWTQPISTATLGPKSSTFVPNPGQCAASTPVTVNFNVVPNVAPTFAAIAPICAGTPPPALPATSIEGFTGTWIPATINTSTAAVNVPYTFTPTSTQCAQPTTIYVTITPAPVTTFNFSANPMTICSGTPVQPLPTTSSNGVTGSWNHPAISNTASDTYIFTPNPGQCASPYTLPVTVLPTTTIQFAALPTNFSSCVGATPPVLPTVSDNGITGTWTPPSIDTSTFGVKTLTFEADGGQCVTSHFYTIYVDVRLPTPTIYGPFMPFCKGGMPTAAENPGGLQLPTTVNGIVGSWSPSNTIDNTLTGPQQYIFTPAANQCALPSTLNFFIIEPEVPIFDQQQIPGFCAGTTPIPNLPTISDNGITGTWVPPVIDNTIAQQYTFIPDASFCATTGFLYVDVFQPTFPGFADPIVFCADQVQALDTISPNGVTGTWTPPVVNPTIPSQVYHFEPDAGQCATSQDVTVVVHPLTLHSVTVTVAGGFFTDGAVVTINAADAGNYLYQLEDGPLYPSNVFTNVPEGIYDVTVYDVNGCSLPIKLIDAVTIVDYPRFFTPNSDGYNDYWNIYDLAAPAIGQQQAPIFIFDRHGKLIKQIAPAGMGWDGTYNGQPLPSSDYWFVVYYTELGIPKEFKAHFSLKR